ncbi:hypothetical protein [Paraburkholderia sp. UCT70]|uniref:hypothetical protein n=1 Tax=Paraburkholderia sp. UCT70 TaxID=2991068 RepID=UPI003D19BE42
MSRGYLPLDLRSRVVGTTSSIKPRRSYVLEGTERTDVIRTYAYGKRLNTGSQLTMQCSALSGSDANRGN